MATNTFPIVITASSDPVLDADEARLLAHCTQLANTRTLALLVALAPHVPDDLLLQWRTCYRDAEFIADWLAASAGHAAA